jgi:hypothetical protein
MRKDEELVFKKEVEEFDLLPRLMRGIEWRQVAVRKIIESDPARWDEFKRSGGITANDLKPLEGFDEFVRILKPVRVPCRDNPR